MSIRVTTQCWEKSRHAGSELLMLLAIADFADDNGKAYPAVGTLAKKCRMSKRNAQYIIKRLEESGELTVSIKNGPPPKFPNLYRINLNANQMQNSSQLKLPAKVKSIVGTDAIQSTSEMQSTAHKPSVTIKEPSKRFSEFWSAYPNCKRKGSKTKCQNVWQKQSIDSVAEQIIAHVKAMASSDNWLRDSGRFIPAPLTYLNQQRWDGAEISSQATSNEVYF